jgi:N-acetylglucosamine kinase-like BadF-type ATPase
MLLAVDGGGTKTHILLADNDGTVLCDAKGGPLSFTVVSQEESLTNLLTTVRQAFKKVKLNELYIQKALIGLAGIDTKEEQKNAADFFNKGLKEIVTGLVQVVNDTEIALASGSGSDNAIVLIAGTGSNCFGKNEFGVTAKAGGLDYMLTDEGSGYSIGHEILKAAVKSYDGRGQKTILEDLVKQWFEVEDMIFLKDKISNNNFNKATIAHLTFLLSKALEVEDSVAKQILNESIQELLSMVKAVATRLDFVTKRFDLVLAGSLFSKKVISFDIFSSKIKKDFVYANCIIPQDPPVYGALKLLTRNNDLGI